VASAHHRSGLLTEKAREIFTAQAAKGLPEIAKAILKKMSDLLSLPASAEQTQERRDAWLAFRSAGKSWVNNTHKAWRLACAESPQSIGIRRDIESGKFELMDNSVMENRIIASRLGLGVLDVVSWELNDLRLRVQSLDNLSALELNDIFKPEVLAQKMIEQWTSTGLSRETWLSAQDVIQSCMAEHLLEAYHTTNEFLLQHGVMAEIDLRPWVKRSPVGSLSPLKPEAFKDSGSVIGSGDHHRSGQSALEEVRMQTGATPWVRDKMRAQGVMGGLMRLLSKQVSDFDKTHGLQASPQLAQALAKIWSGDSSHHPTQVAQTGGLMYAAEHIEQASALLRQRTRTLKKAAATSAEKASIEIVALMFQSILAEDRISAAVRVWFARLQIPVLRVAISEPDFFGSLQHPARRLIDRMGSCVLGFEIDVSDGAMELEIKRIVQVVEQYPETGRRVFQLVDSEFQNFLSKFLSQKGRAAHVVSIAQQVEQKETMTIQYTIEMRNTLIQMPVHDKIRAFLFKTWAEVLAIAAMRHGPQHAQTLTLKRCASDLVWAASAKPNRTDRSQVITDLPKLLQVLRMGMRMLGMDVKTQDENINLISDTLADAFMSKTAAISSERLAAMARRLTHLEDFLSDADVGDLPLDTEALVLMIGIDASDIEVVTDGDSQPTEDMRAWARELQLGSWFSLDHNGRCSHVQFAWRSDRKQLHLFASADGQNFLIQARRLAAYLQAGLLLPAEQEALTVRATRDALAKLEANPERLLDY